jgi:putative permease
MNILSDWFKKVFADRQAVILAVLLVVGTGVVIYMGQMLAPVIAGGIIAYLLEGLVRYLQQQGLPRLLAVVFVFLLFWAFVVVLLFGLAPLLYQQLTQLVQQFPAMLSNGQDLLMRLPETYPRIVSEAQISDITSTMRLEIARLGQNILSWSLSSVVGVITVLGYLILVPLLVFFFLKDKERILGWFHSFLPSDYSLATEVWREVDLQTGNYVRGKFFEIIIMWAASFGTFAYLGLQFAMLLGLMVGLSVIVPYIGAAVVTFPVAVIALTQWGWGPEFFWLLGAYTVIQALDGNVLVPLLFSEAVDLHPIAIIVAVLVFGGIWGFWGVFFAIPLATLVQAVLKAWPREPQHASASDTGTVADLESPRTPDRAA